MDSHIRNVELRLQGGNKMTSYKCPNCGRIYNYVNLSDNVLINCLNCRYPLKKAEDVKNVKHPELNEHNVIGTIENKNIPKCPTCGSTNIKQITGIERAMSIIGLGIFSKKINKSYECNNCGTTW